MAGLPDNRAVSALFRAFGGAGERAMAEVVVSSDAPGMHRAERLAFALWFPLAAAVAAGSAMAPWLGAMAWLLALPGGLLLCHLLPFVFFASGPLWQWRLWLAAGLLWAWFHRAAGGVTGGFAWAWMALGTANLIGFLRLGWMRTMRWHGTGGIVWRSGVLLGAHLGAWAIGFHHGWTWALAGGALIAAFHCIAVLRPCCQWLGPMKSGTGDGSILLTIDDGPDPKDTPMLLDLLDRHGRKAVFFMIGEKVAAHPELAREVLRRGHLIGNHTMTHPQASFWCAGPWRTRREIEECQRTILEVTGIEPKWFRAPVGHRNWFTHPVCGDLGLEVVAWSRRGFDAVETDAAKVLQRILGNLAPGDIILMHEATPISAAVAEGILKRTELSSG
jgi:peptidoglycan/xylan/chitin deacetylase (PgdA/CDA1 family)